MYSMELERPCHLAFLGREGSNKSHLCQAGLRKHRGVMDNERTKPTVAFPKDFLFSQLAYQSID